MKLDLCEKSCLMLIPALIFLTSCQKDLVEDKFSSIQRSHIPASQKTKMESSQLINDWYDLQTRIMLYANPNPSPVVTGRFFGYQGITLYETVRHGIPGSVSLSNLLYQMPAMPAKETNNGYSWSIAANAALAAITRAMMGGLTTQNLLSVDSLEQAWYNQLQPANESEVFRRSQQFGQSVAAAVFEWSKTDGNNLMNASYTLPLFDGAWVPTPPAFLPGAVPFLGNCRPFLASHNSVILPAFPYPFSATPGSAFHDEVSFTYNTAKYATAEQKIIARYWADVGVGTGYSTPGHLMRILSGILKNENSDLAAAALAYAKTGIAMRDVMIMTWRSKYAHSLIRPVTYVQSYIEPGWMPNLVTPNHPEYPAGHATLTSAFMETMTGIFGNHYAFADDVYSFLGYQPRIFSSFTEAANEAGWSRIYAGIHYKTSVERGLALGRETGSHVNSLVLVP